LQLVRYTSEISMLKALFFLIRKHLKMYHLSKTHTHTRTARNPLCTGLIHFEASVNYMEFDTNFVLL